MSVNIGGWPTRHGRLSYHQFDVGLLTETHLGFEDMKRAARQSHELGFTFVGVPKLSSHAGVALLVRKPHRAVLLWKHDSGRLALFQVATGCFHSYCAIVYGVPHEPWTTDSLIMELVDMLPQYQAGPLVVAGDFNAEVEELGSLHELAHMGLQRLHDRSQITCHHAGGETTIDAVLANASYLQRLARSWIDSSCFDFTPLRPLFWLVQHEAASIPKLVVPSRFQGVIPAPLSPKDVSDLRACICSASDGLGAWRVWSRAAWKGLGASDSQIEFRHRGPVIRLEQADSLVAPHFQSDLVAVPAELDRACNALSHLLKPPYHPVQMVKYIVHLQRHASELSEGCRSLLRAVDDVCWPEALMVVLQSESARLVKKLAEEKSRLAGNRKGAWQDFCSRLHPSAVASAVARQARPPAITGMLVQRDGVEVCVQEPSQMMQALVDYWSGFWQDDTPFDAEAFQVQFPLQQRAEEPMPDLTSGDIDEWYQQLQHKACGPDGFTTRELQAVQPEVRSLLADVLNKVELTTWPKDLCFQQVAMIPKKRNSPDGVRPICLLPLLYKCWSRARSRWLRQVFVQVAPSAIAGGRPREVVQLLVGRLSADLHLASVSGECHCGIHSDLTKAYEALPLAALDHVLTKIGLPLRFIRTLLAGYRFRKLVVLNGVAMDAGLPIRGVMAGCALAVWMLGLLTLPLQIAVSSVGFAELRAFVDDMALWFRHKTHNPAEPQRLRQVHSLLLDWCRLLKVELNHKTVVWSIGSVSVQRLMLSSPEFEVYAKDVEIRDLGVDLPLRGKLTSVTHRERILESKLRVQRLDRCSSFVKHEREQAIAVNVLPKAFWGGELFGLPNPPMVELRKSIVKFLRHGEALHRSPHGVLTLAAERPCLDPMFALCLNTLLYWYKWLHHSVNMRGLFLRLWDAAMLELTQHGVVKGPLRHLMQCLRRLRVTAVTPLTWKFTETAMFELDTVSREELAHAIRDAIMRVVCMELALSREDYSGAVLLDRALLRRALSSGIDI
eukprot:6467405-Amphidinium_carterae.1